MLPTPPQFLNQAPPGAQQLTLPDFLNVPHLGHIIALAIVEVRILIDVRIISSRSRNGRRFFVTGCTISGPGAGAGAHVVFDIDPDEPANMPILLAFE